MPEETPTDDDRTSWTRTLDAASVPVNALIESAPPEVTDTLTQKVAQALQTALDHSQALLNKEQLEERLSKARAYPGTEATGYEGHLMFIEEAVGAHCAEVKKRTVLGSCLKAVGSRSPVDVLTRVLTEGSNVLNGES